MCRPLIDDSMCVKHRCPAKTRVSVFKCPDEQTKPIPKPLCTTQPQSHHQTQTHSFLGQLTRRLVQKLGGLMPNGRMMGQHQQTLFGGEHHATCHQRRVFAAQRIRLFERDDALPQLQLLVRKIGEFNTSGLAIVQSARAIKPDGTRLSSKSAAPRADCGSAISSDAPALWPRGGRSYSHATVPGSSFPI